MVSPKLASALKKARDLGRGGDTMLAHINPQEAQVLKSLGGSGKPNPHTGLPEFLAESDASYGGGGYGYGQSNYGSNGGGDTSSGWNTGYNPSGGGGNTTYRSAAAIDAATNNYGGGGYGVGGSFGPSPNSGSGASSGGSWNSPSTYSGGTSVSNSSPTRSSADSFGSALDAGAGIARDTLSSIGSAAMSFGDTLSGWLNDSKPTVEAYGSQVANKMTQASDTLNQGIADGYSYAKNFINEALAARDQPSYVQYASGGVGAPGSEMSFQAPSGPPGLRSEAANGGYDAPASFPSMVPSIDPGPGMDPNSYIGGSRLMGYEGSGNTIYSGFGKSDMANPADLAAPGATETTANLADVNPRLADLIDRFQKQFPDVEITSGFRTPDQNAKVGGAKHSQHLDGNAFDFSVKGLSEDRQAEVANWLRDNGAGGFGYYPGSQSMHADLGSTRYWGPNYSSSSLDRTPSWFQGFAGGTRVAQSVPTPPERPSDLPADGATQVASSAPVGFPSHPVTPTPSWAYGSDLANPNAYASPLMLPAQPEKGLGMAVNTAFNLTPLGLPNAIAGLFGYSIGDQVANRANIPMTPEEALAAENRMYAQGEGKGSNSNGPTTNALATPSKLIQDVKTKVAMDSGWKRAALAHGYTEAQLADPKVAALIKQIFDMGLIPTTA